jgi:hypothetical protein
LFNPQLSQVAVRRSDGRVGGTECLLQNGKRTVEERFSIGVATQDKVQRGQVVERLGDDTVLGAKFPYRNGQRLFGNLRCLEVHAYLVELLHLPAERLWIGRILRLWPVITRRTYSQRNWR